jgi:hypothetical protein
MVIFSLGLTRVWEGLFAAGLFICWFFFFFFGLVVFDMAEEKFTVIVQGKPPLLHDDMPKSISSKKLNGPNYLAWAHAVKSFFVGNKNRNI